MCNEWNARSKLNTTLEPAFCARFTAKFLQKVYTRFSSNARRFLYFSTARNSLLPFPADVLLDFLSGTSDDDNVTRADLPTNSRARLTHASRRSGTFYAKSPANCSPMSRNAEAPFHRCKAAPIKRQVCAQRCEIDFETQRERHSVKRTGHVFEAKRARTISANWSSYARA